MSKSENDLIDIPKNLKLTSKWGCDGSSGHSVYQQSFTDGNMTDKHMFLTSLVPLTLTENNKEKLLYWKNLTPSSTRFCRPIKFEFVKETANVITEEVNRVENEIRNLNNSVVIISNRIFEICHCLALTIIDGKVVNTVTETSAISVCFICTAKPKEMNDLDGILRRTVNEGSLRFGISPLHARIKFMECILHIAYNKHFCKWRTDDRTKKLKADEKARIQADLKSSLGINVDVVKQGLGTTNDGNTSRTFFENPAKTADIVGVDENLMHRFKIILNTINSQAAIDPQKFEIYCMKTARLYVSLYEFYYMPMTVHKVLMHGRIVSSSILPLGMLSEEAQEARNKDYKKYRLNHFRKCDRISTNQDVMHLLLASSVPFINGFRTNPKNKTLELDDDVKKLLVE